MRTTQFIGLTNDGYNYISKCKSLKSDLKTQGMFFENIPLGRWENKMFKEIQEVVQCSPWSSGPMIFTKLVGYFHNDKKLKNPINLFEWVLNPELSGEEYDQEKGQYWV